MMGVTMGEGGSAWKAALQSNERSKRYRCFACMALHEAKNFADLDQRRSSCLTRHQQSRKVVVVRRGSLCH